MFRYQLRKYAELSDVQIQQALALARIVELEVSDEALAELDATYLGEERAAAVRALAGRRFDRQWQLEQALVDGAEAWQKRESIPINELYNKGRSAQLGYLYELLQVAAEEPDELGAPE